MKRILLAVCSICVLFCGCQSSDSKDQKRLKALQKEISELEAKAAQYRKRSFSEVMEAQKDMMTEWEDFARDIQSAEEFEDQAQVLEEKLKQLKGEVKELRKDTQAN